MASDTFEEWAIVGLMGHQRIAGLIREVTIAGAGFLRIDVPAIDTEQPFSRIFGSTAIYSIDLVTEATARAVAAGLRVSPVSRWDVSPLIEDAVKKTRLQLRDEYDDDHDSSTGE